MAQLSKRPYPMPKANDIRERIRLGDKVMAELKQKSLELEPGKIVGAILQFSVADGFAPYIVVKEKPLTLQWIPFLDEYRADPALIRGLRKADIQGRLETDKRWNEIISRGAREKESE